MATMTAGWIYLFALCFSFVSSIDEDSSCSGDCETHPLRVRDGSSVLLHCNATKQSVDSVSWSHAEADLVTLKPNGLIKFLDHRKGRVKVFPNEGLVGNYSIRIDELQKSDLGCYRCQLGQDCFEVDLVRDIGSHNNGVWLLVYICVGVAAFILLNVACFFCIKCFTNTKTLVISPAAAGAEAASAPPEELCTVPVQEHQRGASNHHLVYENDDQDPRNQQVDPRRHQRSLPGAPLDLRRTPPDQSSSTIYPNLAQGNFERMESQRTKQGFHRDLFNRLRQASLSRHHYVNQREISQQQVRAAQAENQPRADLPRKKKGKKDRKERTDNCEFNNPIYNRSTDVLNQWGTNDE